MSEENNGAAEAPPIIINGQYVKDLSFEVPNAPGVYAELSKAQPEIEFSTGLLDLMHWNRISQLER